MKNNGRTVALLLTSTMAYAEPSLPEVEKSGIEYSSPQAAYEALSKKEGVTIRKERSGWVIASDKNTNAIWSFPPAGDPSYPAVVKRIVVESEKAVSIKMDVECGANKIACDNLVRQFVELNQKIQQEMKNRTERGG